MHFEDKLKNYANLLIAHGLNVQPGQLVNITGEIYHQKLIQHLVEAAYKRGAKYVGVDYIDPVLSRLKILHGKDDHLTFVPPFIPFKYESFVEEGAAVLRLTGSEMPDILADLPAQKVNSVQSALRQSLKKYYSEGIGKSKVQWTVAAAATPAWGKKVFPELSEEKALDALWEEIFKICRADKKECLSLWKEHNAKLKKRGEKLTAMKIKELHFSGPGTDLFVGLSPKAIFKGGGDTTPKGIPFEANIPTEECFTTPDFRMTKGKVKVTRPVTVNGQLVKGLSMEFSDGKICSFSAEEGEDTFAAYIQNDDGASYLGEVALVGIDSPIYQSGRVFEEILFDENAACHIAVGFAYRFCIVGGDTMSDKELQQIGCNDSRVHTDFMISSDQVDVDAVSFNDQKFKLIEKGRWIIDL